MSPNGNINFNIRYFRSRSKKKKEPLVAFKTFLRKERLLPSVKNRFVIIPTKLLFIIFSEKNLIISYMIITYRYLYTLVLAIDIEIV